MKRLLLSLVLLWASSWPVAHAQAILSPQQFTDKFVTLAKKELPGVSLKVLEPLQLELRVGDNGLSTPSLTNAYKQYEQSPASLDQVIANHLATMKSTVATLGDKKSARPGSPEQIVPMVKNRAFRDESARQISALQQRTGKSTEKILPVSEVLAEDLYVYYAFDLPDSFRYLLEEDVKRLGLSPRELRNKAVENLTRMLGASLKVEQRGSLFFISFDGNFEASLLLVDALWDKKNFSVQGDLVAYVLARDVLLVTGSKEKEWLQIAATTAKDAEKLPYFISEKPYVRKNGTWVLLSQQSAPR